MPNPPLATRPSRRSLLAGALALPLLGQVAGPLAARAGDVAGTPAATPATGEWQAVAGPGYDGVVVPVDAADEFRFAFLPPPSGYWLPDAGLIAELEAGLPATLATANDERAHPIVAELGTYERQYVGAVVAGRAVIYVNAFCVDPMGDGSWRHETVFIMDGGDCFFQVQYEPATRTYRDLRINGNA